MACKVRRVSRVFKVRRACRVRKGQRVRRAHLVLRDRWESEACQGNPLCSTETATKMALTIGWRSCSVTSQVMPTPRPLMTTLMVCPTFWWDQRAHEAHAAREVRRVLQELKVTKVRRAHVVSRVPQVPKVHAVTPALKVLVVWRVRA